MARDDTASGQPAALLRAWTLFQAQPDTLRAVLIMSVAIVCFAVMNTMIRYVSRDVHPFEIAFWRNAFGLMWLLPWVLVRARGHLKTSRIGLHLVRAGINVASMTCFFVALSISPLAKVASLGFTLPLFTTLLAVIFLGERLKARRITALGVGVVGALIIVRPWDGNFDLGSALVLGGTAIWAVALLITRVMGRTESALTVTTYMALLLTPLSLPAAVTVWSWPTVENVAFMSMIGLVGTFGVMGVARSFALAEANALMPYDFQKLIWAALMGYLFFGEVPEIWTWVGGAVIFSATVYLAYREAQLRKAEDARAAVSSGGGPGSWSVVSERKEKVDENV